MPRVKEMKIHPLFRVVAAALVLLSSSLRAQQQSVIIRGVMLAAPIAYVTFDLVENAMVLALLKRYPERLSVLAAALPYATIIKRVASVLALLLPLAVLTFRRWIPISKPHSTTS